MKTCLLLAAAAACLILGFVFRDSRLRGERGLRDARYSTVDDLPRSDSDRLAKERAADEELEDGTLVANVFLTGGIVASVVLGRMALKPRGGAS